MITFFQYVASMGQQLGLMRSFQTVIKPPVRRNFVMNALNKPWTSSVLAPAPAEEHPPTISLRQSLLHGYRPDIRQSGGGREAKAALMLGPHQKICYYPGKLHGGYQAFLMDHIFADCCSPALTANLSIDFMLPISPRTTLLLNAWPAKIEGRKIFMEGSIMIAEEMTGEMVPAARAKALFIVPKNKAT